MFKDFFYSDKLLFEDYIFTSHDNKNILLEDVFSTDMLSYDQLSSLYDTMHSEYTNSVGTSWSKDKFIDRAKNWKFFGDLSGFVAIRPQTSGPYKLVSTAGNRLNQLRGFKELNKLGKPIWGMVSKDIQSMLHKLGYKTPPSFIIRQIASKIPPSVFGGSDVQLNKDGSVTIDYPDVGKATKYFIANSEYFDWAVDNINLPKPIKWGLKKLVENDEDTNNISPEVLQKITNMIEYNNIGELYEISQSDDFKSLPQKLKNAIILNLSKYTYYAYLYAKDVLKGQKVPKEIIDSIINDPEFAYNYAKDVLKGQKVPKEIIIGFSKNPYYAYDYAKDVLKGQKVPKEIIDSISKDPIIAYEYAQYVLKWQKVPKEIIIGFSKNTEYAYNYAYYILKGQNVPKEIIDRIINDTEYAYYYAKDILKWQKVPKEIMFSISNNTEYAYLYAKDVLKGQKVPKEIINSIIKNVEYAYYYAKDVLKWQKVPKEILQSISADKNFNGSIEDAVEIFLKNLDNYNTNYAYPYYYNSIEYFPSLVEKLKNIPHIYKWFIFPKLEAQKYNKSIGGLFIHSFDQYESVEYLLDNDNDNDSEICVSSIDSHTVFNSSIILVGKGNIRLLYDFDCYSYIDSTTGLRYASNNATEYKYLDVNIQSKEERVKSAIGVTHIGDSYYDEGFIRPSQVEWLFATGTNTYALQSIHHEYGAEIMDINIFNNILKSGDYSKLYDFIENITSGFDDSVNTDDDSDDSDDTFITTPTQNIPKSPNRGKGKKPKKISRRIDKYNQPIKLEETPAISYIRNVLHSILN